MVRKIFGKDAVIVSGILGLVLYMLSGVLSAVFYVKAVLIISYVLLGYTAIGGVILTAETRGRLKLQRIQMILLGFTGWFLISCVSKSFREGADVVSSNMANIVDVAVLMLVAFPLGTILARENKRSIILKIALRVLVFGWSLFWVYILIVIFQGKKIVTPTGGAIEMLDGLWLQMNCHYNLTAMGQLTFFMGSAYLALLAEKKLLKAAYLSAAAVNYISIVLTNSRTSFYCAVIGGSMLVGVIGYLKTKDKKILKRILIAVGITAGTAVVLYLSRKAIFGIYNSMISGLSGVEAYIRDLSMDGAGTLNGRTNIWMYAFNGTTRSASSLIFGDTPVYIPYILNQFSNGKRFAYTHNQLVEVFSSTGVVGFVIFMAFLVLMLRNTWKLAIKQRNETAYLCIPVIIFILLMANQMEAMLMYFRVPSSYVFFFLCGVLEGLVNRVKG